MQVLESRRADDVTLAKFLRRPEVGWAELVQRFPEFGQVRDDVALQVLHDVKYAGYIHRQLQQVQRQQRLAGKRIPRRLRLPSAAAPARRSPPKARREFGRSAWIRPAESAASLRPTSRC